MLNIDLLHLKIRQSKQKNALFLVNQPTTPPLKRSKKKFGSGVHEKNDRLKKLEVRYIENLKISIKWFSAIVYPSFETHL